jgi:predicted ferric reductase
MNLFSTRRALAAGSALLLLAVPLLVFWRNAGPLSFYFGDGFPPGQAAYIMMRPAGHIAFVLLFFQVVLGVMGRPVARFLGYSTLTPLHRALGIVTLSFLLLHPLLFLWARSLRAGKLEFVATFFPNPFENYWEKMLFLGAIGFFLLLAGVIAGVVGKRWRHWRAVHLANYAAFFLVFSHSISIGSETRLAPVELLYWGMALAAAGLLGWRLISTWKSFGRPDEVELFQGSH